MFSKLWNFITGKNTNANDQSAEAPYKIEAPTLDLGALPMGVAQPDPLGSVNWPFPTAEKPVAEKTTAPAKPKVMVPAKPAKPKAKPASEKTAKPKTKPATKKAPTTKKKATKE